MFSCVRWSHDQCALNEVIEELEKVLPCIGLTAFDADGSGAPNAILVDTSDVNSASTAASGM